MAGQNHYRSKCVREFFSRSSRGRFKRTSVPRPVKPSDFEGRVTDPVGDRIMAGQNHVRLAESNVVYTWIEAEAGRWF